MKLRIEWGSRAVKFKEKVSNQGQERLTNKCWLEKIEKGERDNYCKERRQYYNRLGFSSAEIENLKSLKKEINKKRRVTRIFKIL